MFGINTSWLATIPSLAEKVANKFLGEYLEIPISKSGIPNKEEFQKIWSGNKTVKKGLSSLGNGLLTAIEAVNDSSFCLHEISKKSYFGGYNSCPKPGVYLDKHTNDWDIIQAYITGLCMTPDPDWSDPIQKSFPNNYLLTLDDFDSPIDMLFCCIDYEFPADTKYPCIPIRVEDSCIFPIRAEEVYASGPDLYLALKLDCKITVKRGYKVRLRMKNNKLSRSLLSLCKLMSECVLSARQIYGEKSAVANLVKLIANAIYGKIAQGVIDKRLWNGKLNTMEKMGPSTISSPERAAHVTSIIRAMLMATMTELHKKGIESYSVTTDGFISEATKEQLDDCSAYGFRDIFKSAREAISGSPEIWKKKHEQTILLNPTTRCNVGFGIDKKGVLAHGGYCTGVQKDSEEDRQLMAKTILTRNNDTSYSFMKHTSLKEMILKDVSYEETPQERHISLNYDFKRLPVWENAYDVSAEVGNERYAHVCFDTMPFETVEDFISCKKVLSKFGCIRTLDDLTAFKVQLEGKQNGVRYYGNTDRKKLMAVVRGYGQSKWAIPELSECKNLNDKLAVINRHNHSDKPFTRNDWKNANRADRVSNELPEEMLTDLLLEFGAIRQQ